MIFNLVRKLHISTIFRAAESNLAILRKKTGYTIANCKKALEMHNNDVNKAEAWLNEQAQALGWVKATKLSGRPAAQGLIAVKFDTQHGALVELNCETDFVAKNEKFHKMIEDAATACFKLAHTKIQSHGPVTKLELDTEQLGNLTAEHGKKLSEMLALFIGSVGENAVLRRAECWKAKQDIKITGYAHPANGNTTEYSTGKYGALLAYKQEGDGEDLGGRICQHIVGCAPIKIGDKKVDKPANNEDDETCLIYQDYLLDPSVTVGQLMEENKIEIVDFVRLTCGEVKEATIPGVEKQPLESVQTLQ